MTDQWLRVFAPCVVVAPFAFPSCPSK